MFSHREIYIFQIHNLHKMSSTRFGGIKGKCFLNQNFISYFKKEDISDKVPQGK